MASPAKIGPNSSGTTQSLPVIANIKNHHFASVHVGPKLANNMSPSTRDFKDYLGNSNFPNFFFL